MKRLCFAFCALLTVLCLAGCSPAVPPFDPFDTEEDGAESSPDREEAPLLPLLSLDGRRYSFTGDEEAITAKDDLLTIKEAGAYRLTGELTEGGLAVEVGWGETVRLILDGVSIRSSKRPALSVISAAAVVVETAADSVNLLFSESHSVMEADTNLVLCGKGSLSLSGAKTAVRASGSLTMEDGTLRATASEYGFLSEKRIEIRGGTAAVNAAKFGYATRESSSLGGIFVYGGALTAVCSEAALSAHGMILLAGGSGSFDCPAAYQCEHEGNGKAVKGTILQTGGSFPPIPS